MKTLSNRGVGLLTTSLLLAGVSALSPASVRAAGSTCSFGNNMAFTACSTTFAFDKVGDKTLKLVDLPNVGNGTIQFTQQSPGIYVVDVDFVTDLMAPAGPGFLTYDLTIDPQPLNKNYFSEAGLAIIGPPVGSPQFKVIKTATGVPDMIMADEFDPKATALFDDLIKTTRVRDDYRVTTGSINSFQNSFTQIERAEPSDAAVPGPLPLLGAGAAFGFSRRLRTRVLAARRA
jgi:hypothetical protein